MHWIIFLSPREQVGQRMLALQCLENIRNPDVKKILREQLRGYMNLRMCSNV